MIKRHQKPDLNNHEGGIIDVPAPIHISKVMIVDKNGKPSAWAIVTKTARRFALPVRLERLSRKGNRH
jgi:ribosomal protein L24